jgi:hypothetical protein
MMFIPWIIRALVGRGIAQGTAERVAKPLLYLIALIALAGLLWGAVAIHDRRVVNANDAQQEAKLTPVIAKAGDNAAAQRATDTIAISKTEEETHRAIHSVPDAAPAAPSVRLGCQRLRNAGKDITRIPACSGLASVR